MLFHPWLMSTTTTRMSQNNNTMNNTTLNNNTMNNTRMMRTMSTMNAPVASMTDKYLTTMLEKNVTAMGFLQCLYDETGVRGLYEFRQELKAFTAKVVKLEEMEMEDKTKPTYNPLDKIGKEATKNKKALHKSLKTYFTKKKRNEKQKARAELKEAKLQEKLAMKEAMKLEKQKARAELKEAKLQEKLAIKKARAELKEEKLREKLAMKAAMKYEKELAKKLTKLEKTAKATHKKLMKELRKATL